MSITNSLRRIMKTTLEGAGLQVQRLAPNQIRGINPLADIAFLLNGRRSPIIFDVGANDGEMSSAFLDRFPDARLYAFEPFAGSFNKLVARFSKARNVKVENIALGETSGHAELNVFSADRMNSLLELSEDPNNLMKGFRKTGAAPVQIETLDNFCQTRNIPSIDVLKIDTQGYDLHVLKGAAGLLRANRVAVVLLEVNFTPMYSSQASFSELHAFLSSSKFRLVDFYNHVWKNGCTAWCDACYVATPA